MTFLANEIKHTLLLGWGQWGQLQLSFHVWEEEQRLFILCRHGGRQRDVRAGESFPVSLLFFSIAITFISIVLIIIAPHLQPKFAVAPVEPCADDPLLLGLHHRPPNHLLDLHQAGRHGQNILTLYQPWRPGWNEPEDDSVPPWQDDRS